MRRLPDSREATVRDEKGGVRKRGLWTRLNGHVPRKRRNSQALAYSCARRISIPTGRTLSATKFSKTGTKSIASAISGFRSTRIRCRSSAHRRWASGCAASQPASARPATAQQAGCATQTACRRQHASSARPHQATPCRACAGPPAAPTRPRSPHRSRQPAADPTRRAGDHFIPQTPRALRDVAPQLVETGDRRIATGSRRRIAGNGNNGGVERREADAVNGDLGLRLQQRRGFDNAPAP
jgi:hypothetical protein